MIRRTSSHRTIRRGIIAPLAAILIVVLLGMIAFAVDIGYITMARSEAQNAADSAAMAGVTKLADQLRTSTLTSGKPTQTTAHLNTARDEAIAFALKNYIATHATELKTAEVEFGYMSNPFDHSSNTLDTSGWPARPYNACRVTITRDDDHAGGPLKLFFGPILGVSEKKIEATATSVLVLGTATVKGNSSSTRRGGLLPFTYQVDKWHAVLNATSSGVKSVTSSYGYFSGSVNITIQDSFKVAAGSTGPSGVTSAADSVFEVNVFPLDTTPGNFGTINFTKTKSSNSTSVLGDLVRYGPDTEDWTDLPDILEASHANQVAVNGEPGISNGIKDDVAAIKGETRVLPLFSTVSGTGNNTFYNLVEFVPVTIVDVNLTGNPKYIKFQPAFASVDSIINGTSRFDFDVTPSATPDLFFLGKRSLVR